MQRWMSLFWIAGRLKRRSYWLGALSLLIASLAAQILTKTLPAPLGAAIYAVAEAIVAWIAVCLFARRLHDLGRSGWLQVPALVLTLLGSALIRPQVAGALHLNPTLQAVGVMFGVAAYFGFIISLGLMRGTNGPNRYGEA